jgi:RNA polymerase sigma factor (TIGR02999 family)
LNGTALAAGEAIADLSPSTVATGPGDRVEEGPADGPTGETGWLQAPPSGAAASAITRNGPFMLTSVDVAAQARRIPFRRKLGSKRLTGMLPSSPPDVTRLLREWSQGDQEALKQLVTVMYAELRQLAHRRLRNEPPNRSINTTALVHDAYLRLIDVRHASFHDRAHFLAMASRVMRRLLIDQARARRAGKRGGGAGAAELDEALWVSEPQAEALTELDEALRRLEALDPRQGQIVEQRYFGGLTLEETAEALNVSLATVKRELRFAHAWLATELRNPGAHGSDA